MCFSTCDQDIGIKRKKEKKKDQFSLRKMVNLHIFFYTRIEKTTHESKLT